MNKNIIPFRGTELVKNELDLVLEFEKILGHPFKIVDEITWKLYDIHTLTSKAERYFYDQKDQRDEVDFVWQLAISNSYVIGLGLYLNHIKELPRFISEFKSLEYLVLNAGDLEIILDSIGELKHLRILILRENKIKTLPDSIGNLNKLERLDLGRNQIYSLPESIGNLGSLTSLWLDNNQIKTLPDSFRNLQTLDEIHLTYNQFELLPNPLKYLKNLTRLNANYLNLGELPEWIGELKSLESLVVTNNNLTKIPKSIDKLKNLKSFLLNDNNLTNLPESIIELDSLELLNINGNNIQNLSKIFVPLKRRGVRVVTTGDEISFDWDLNIRIELNKILNEGQNLISVRKYEEAMEKFNAAEKLVEELSDFNTKMHYQGAILNLTGHVYVLNRNYQKALENAKEMLVLMERKDDNKGKAIVYNNMGNAYNGMGKKKEALKYYKMGLELLNSQGMENSPDALTIKRSIKDLKKK